MSKTSKNIIIAAVIIAFVAVGYFLFFSSNTDTVDLLNTPNPTDNNEFEQEVVSLLLELQAVELDGRFLSSPLLSSMEDRTVELTPRPVGRTHPFAPVGYDPSGPDLSIPLTDTSTPETEDALLDGELESEVLLDQEGGSAAQEEPGV